MAGTEARIVALEHTVAALQGIVQKMYAEPSMRSFLSQPQRRAAGPIEQHVLAFMGLEEDDDVLSYAHQADEEQGVYMGSEAGSDYGAPDAGEATEAYAFLGATTEQQEVVEPLGHTQEEALMAAEEGGADDDAVTFAHLDAAQSKPAKTQFTLAAADDEPETYTAATPMGWRDEAKRDTEEAAVAIAETLPFSASQPAVDAAQSSIARLSAERERLSKSIQRGLALVGEGSTPMTMTLQSPRRERRVSGLSFVSDEQ